ncbi:hypothetical protein H6P81_021301 [Aristolochia fimbriata]|uniref:Uncharacterized protein n=1 Tax=Aristolochia fimbriata TaxID=158543 RepID=A0AAV7DRB4_ARIFI|nr:hypothetical protein H6P81_021301 [Aristolochia fimbriata]
MWQRSERTPTAKAPAGPTLTLRDESWGANGIKIPSSPSRKRWIPGAVRIDPYGAVANALEVSATRVLGLSCNERNHLVFSCHHWVWNPEQTAGDKPEEVRMTSSHHARLCPGRHTCTTMAGTKGSRSREGELTQKPVPQFGLQAATLACMTRNR